MESIVTDETRGQRKYLGVDEKYKVKTDKKENKD